jgi:hypothetical protein
MILAARGILQAQTAAEMDAVLISPAVSAAQASRFVLAAADVTDEPAEAAYALAREKGWLPKKAAPDRPIRLGELSFLIMKAFNIKGSFLYALFPGPRYAFRELDYLKLIPGRRDPAMLVSGEWILQILNMVLNYRGEPFIEAEEPAGAPAGEPAAEQPLGDKVTEEGRAINRRVEITLLNE